MAAPKTLTRAEFMRHPASKKPGASYEGYLRFVAKRRGARLAAAAADPLAPTPEPVIRQQTTQAVRAQIDPIIANIMRDTDRAASGINLATGTHIRALEPYDEATRERFDRAEEATAGVADALHSRLTGSGAAAAGGLREKLAAINAGTSIENELAGGVETFAKGAANAGFGIDSAALEELISRGVGAEDFAAALPGIARIAGQRAVGDVRATGQRSIAEVRGKVPGLVSELLEGARDREVNKAIAKLGLQKTQAEIAADQQQAEYESTKPDAALSNSLGYLVDSNGVPILNGAGQPIPTQGALDDQTDAANEKADDRKAALKARGEALASAKTKARDRARELYKGEKVKKGGLVGGETIKRVSTAEAVRLILADLQPDLARFGVKPGTPLWKDVRNAVLDAVIDAGFQVGAKDPTKAKPRGADEQKPRGG